MLPGPRNGLLKLHSMDLSGLHKASLTDQTMSLFYCFLQLSKTVTVFLGGSVDSYRIVTYDWATQTYSANPTKVIKGRQLHTIHLWLFTIFKNRL